MILGLSMLAGAAFREIGLSAASTRFGIEVVDRPSAIKLEWRQLEAAGVGTVFQRYDWVDAYARHVLPHEEARPAIVLGRLDGVPAFILPLAVSTVGPVRVASWIGGNHAGYNFGLWSPEGAAALAGMERAEVEGMLGGALNGADCAVLERMPRLHAGLGQPLAALSSTPSPTEGYSFSLCGGMPAVLARRDAASRRRRIAGKERRMGEFGAVETRTLRDFASANAALDFFAREKAQRLAEQGFANSFAAPGVMDFLRDLLVRSQHMREPVLEMAELSVGGRTRAVIGGGLHRGRANIYFTTFAKDEAAAYSPGQVLMFRHIEEAGRGGAEAYDLGVGYEDYKTHWCDVVHELNDAYVAFTPLGGATIAAIRFGQAMKDRVRRNQPLWRRLKSAQAYLSRVRFERNG
jgi:CelD/BcsL family acetyltransferase involved in cellulose biosynthesis